MVYALSAAYLVHQASGAHNRLLAVLKKPIDYFEVNVSKSPIKPIETGFLGLLSVVSAWQSERLFMITDQQANPETTRLPKEFVDRLTNPFVRFLHIESASGAVLLLFTIAALVLSNSPWAHIFERAWETQVGLQLGSLEFVRSLREWINDGLIACIGNARLSRFSALLPGGGRRLVSS